MVPPLLLSTQQSCQVAFIVAICLCASWSCCVVFQTLPLDVCVDVLAWKEKQLEWGNFANTLYVVMWKNGLINYIKLEWVCFKKKFLNAFLRIIIHPLKCVVTS